MIEYLGSNSFYVVVIFIVVIAVASLFGLVIFASKEEKFEDVVAAQRKEQEVFIESTVYCLITPSSSFLLPSKFLTFRSHLGCH